MFILKEATLPVNKQNKKAETFYCFSLVPGTGIEPAHPCERQILSLLRLPIPPPGHMNWGVILNHSR